MAEGLPAGCRCSASAFHPNTGGRGTVRTQRSFGVTKRLGVLPESFVHIVSHALSCASPRNPPSLQYLSSLMPLIRQHLWDAALLCFRTACAARSWLLRGVAAGEVFAAEEALSAQLLYERRRAGVSKTRTRVVVVPAPSPTRASSRPRKRPRLPGFSVAWMGEFVDVPAEVPGRMRGFLPPAHLPTLCRLV